MLTTVRKIVAIALSIIFSAPAAPAQNQQRPVRPSSDLAESNLSRVSATSAQIDEVLRREPALLIELKKWIANEATQRGQIVEDNDLSDASVSARLQDDSEFRGVATRLLQRYGFLIPKVNPESELGKQRELILQEKAKLIAKSEMDEERRQAEPRIDRASEREPDVERDGERLKRNERTQSRDDVRRTPREDRTVDEMGGSDTSISRAAGQLPASDRERAALLAQAAGSGAAGSALGPELRPQLTTPEDYARANDLSAGMAMREFEETARGGRGKATRRSARGANIEDSSELASRPNPYADVPSLYDLYRQAAPRTESLERFGAEVFRDLERLDENLPMDLPVGPEYVVGPGDGLTVDIWGGISQRLTRTVDREGRINLPEVGPLLVSGRTMGEVQRTVQQLLRTQFRDVSADVSLARLRTIRVYVVGDVARPGPYEVSSLSSPLNALFQASGPTERGSYRIVRHMRGNQVVQEVDVYDLLLRGVRSDLKRLENGDTVLVPPLGAMVRVEGMVRRPALYELRGEKSLAQVLELAGGILPTATLRNIQVQRLEAHEKRTMLSVDVPPDATKEAAEQEIQKFQIRDNDEVRVFPIAGHNQHVVYLQGHVLRPGKYSYRPGMKVNDLLASFQELLAEPALKYAEIIRLRQPDYRPSVESFDLGVALNDPNKSPALEPMDTVRVFSRYDFEDPPAVWVGGEVHRPGPYRTAGQVHLRDAVHLAGGVKPDASLANVQVFRYLPDSTLKIFSVDLGSALAGNPVDNILLSNRDRIVVHRNVAKLDPPSVFIKGEVAKPGRYPLTTNMRVAELIGIAGGLKRSALTSTADLTRFILQEGAAPTGSQTEVNLAAAVAGDPAYDFVLRDGDTLTIRQLPGWADIGASVIINGEMQHPGTYGIRPGEKLSSVLKRAGGFSANAFPQGIVFQRGEVREFQQKSRQELISRIEQESGNVRVAVNTSAQEQAALQQAALLQQQRVLENLRRAPVTGRLVVRLHGNLPEFEKSPDDIELRDGDRIHIPKKPNFVIVTGQVYISNAITYIPRKNGGWYLERAGGPTDMADKKNIFIVRANGEVVSGESGGWWSGGVLSQRVQPGDTIVVPEKPIGGSTIFRNVLTVAQVAASAAVSAAVLVR